VVIFMLRPLYPTGIEGPVPIIQEIGWASEHEATKLNNLNESNFIPDEPSQSDLHLLLYSIMALQLFFCPLVGVSVS
jgi:hypothetical protein